jgi:hypothetical protein
VLACCLLGGVSTNCNGAPQDQTGSSSTKSLDATETSAQQKGSVQGSADSETDYDTSLGLHVFRDLAGDQKAIWTSPFHVRLVDAEWLVPLGITAGLMLSTDSDVSKRLSNSPSRIKDSNDLANYGIASMAAFSGGLYLWGRFTHDDHKRETGFLAAEAAIDSTAADYALKYALGRERPLQDNYQGNFFKGGDSFPSEHASAAWAVAGVVAHEYPGPLTSLFAYGLASAISASRVTGKQHFPSDVLVGSAVGWLISRYVYSAHHDPELGGGEWHLPVLEPDLGRDWSAKNMGSPYVPLDSWVYPALDRLAAAGYISSAIEGLRPWTRLECARLVTEAGDHVGDRDSESMAQLYSALEGEFANEVNLLGGGTNRSLQLESVYARLTEISGEPLRDSFDFAQTIVNDFGRPYSQGTNSVAGMSGWASAGPLIAYARVEYQHAPSTPPFSAAARQVIEQEDAYPVEPPNTPVPSVNQVDLLEGYVGLQLYNWQITFGKQSEWWGPDQSGPMMFSDNAEPVNMLRINRTSPFKLPSIFGLLGPIRVELFVGELEGHHWIYGENTGYIGSFSSLFSPQPYINGQAFSFKPTSNLEFGFNRTTIFSGAGEPFTAHRFVQSVFSLGNGLPGAIDDPGDRRSGFDLNYRLPWFRKWLTFYADGFTDDQITPVAYWDRSAWTSGLYMPRVPHVPKLELRVEGVYTDLPIGGSVSHGFFYDNKRYLNGYTNWGNLLGSWIGRQGQGAEGWATYWFSPRNKLQLNYRHQKVSKQFIADGGTLTDVGVNADFLIRSRLSVTGSVQYETWDFPVISSARTNDVTTSIGFTFWPGWSSGESRQSAKAGDN